MDGLIGYIRDCISGLRFRLLLMLLVACAPLVVLTLHSALKDRRAAEANWRNASNKLFSSIKDEEETLVRATRQLLLAASQDNGIRSLSPVAAKRSLDEFSHRYPRYSNLGIITTNGEIVASALPTEDRSVNRRVVRQAAERRTFVSTRFYTAKTNAQPVIHFYFPVQQYDGTPAAVVFAEISLAALKSLRPTSLREGACWMAMDRGGNIIAAHPSSSLWVGQNVRDPWLVTNVFAKSSGLIEGVNQGQTRVSYAFNTGQSRFVSGEVAYILSIPRQVLFARADAEMWQHVLALGIAIGIALVLGWIGSQLLILRPVEALVRSSARLAAGDLSVRTGLRPTRDELGQLTLAFDQMAQSLQQRELDRQRASHKLQLLSHKLVEVQESERRHIARELHDEIGQTLTSAEINLQAALQMRGSAAMERRLEDSIHAVERVLEQVHDLSLNLRPSMLDDLGLEPALRWYTHRQAALTGLQAEFRAEDLEGRFGQMVETECFRVAQEALTNVVRHAQARKVAVELTRRDGHLHLCVSDDGVGFDVNALREKAVHGASLGLLSMEERTSLAGGGLEFHSVPGQGTEVHAWFPLKTNTEVPLAQLNE